MQDVLPGCLFQKVFFENRKSHDLSIYFQAQMHLHMVPGLVDPEDPLLPRSALQGGSILGPQLC